MTVELFRSEISEAIKAYDRQVVCLEKPPEDMQGVLVSLLEKAIKAYVAELKDTITKGEGSPWIGI